MVPDVSNRSYKQSEAALPLSEFSVSLQLTRLRKLFYF